MTWKGPKLLFSHTTSSTYLFTPLPVPRSSVPTPTMSVANRPQANFSETARPLATGWVASCTAGRGSAKNRPRFSQLALEGRPCPNAFWPYRIVASKRVGYRIFPRKRGRKFQRHPILSVARAHMVRTHKRADLAAAGSVLPLSFIMRLASAPLSVPMGAIRPITITSGLSRRGEDDQQ